MLAAIISGNFLVYELARFSRIEANVSTYGGVPPYGIDLTVVAEGWSRPVPVKTATALVETPAGRGTATYDFVTRNWRLKNTAGKERLLPPPLKQDDVDWIAPGMSKLNDDDTSTLLNHAASLAVLTFSSGDLRPPGTRLNTSGRVFSSGFEMTTDVYLPWLCLLVWGVGLPYIGAWRGTRLFGEEARAHLRSHLAAGQRA